MELSLYNLSVCLFLIGFGGYGIWWADQSTLRQAEDVLEDLFEKPDTNRNSVETAADKPRKDQREAGFAYRLRLIAVAFSLIAVRLFFGIPSPPGLFVVVIVSLAIGHLSAEAGIRRRAIAQRKQLEFFLPIVMERIVMAVQSGHDVLGAIKALLDMEKTGAASAASRIPDPVSQLLGSVYLLAENGIGVEQGLDDVARTVDCPAIRHAFLHLAQAHREGGELVMPLRELGDSTQLYYQESVEEEIAKLPVRATLPLLCTFAGLIALFLTAPLLQVIDITTKAMPK
jgi:Flp pilus assembly protein TadB